MTNRTCTACRRPITLGFRVVDKGGTPTAVVANPKSKQVRCVKCAAALVAEQRRA